MRPTTSRSASSVYGEVWPAAWSSMLALRSRGLGSSLTMIHLGDEPEVARLPDIPDGVSQAGLLPVAYFRGDDFRPGPRRPLEGIVFHDRWGGGPRSARSRMRHPVASQLPAEP